tara:strand:- start:5679 stop:6011 length:333 start_codon:yes stop_codon:yes gene_type:complete
MDKGMGVEGEEENKWSEKVVEETKDPTKEYHEPSPADSMRSKYSAQNPYGEELFSKEDYMVKDPIDVPPITEEVEQTENEYVKVKLSWIEGLKDFDTWSRWRLTNTEYKR